MPSAADVPLSSSPCRSPGGLIEGQPGGTRTLGVWEGGDSCRRLAFSVAYCKRLSFLPETMPCEPGSPQHGRRVASEHLQSEENGHGQRLRQERLGMGFSILEPESPSFWQIGTVQRADWLIPLHELVYMVVTLAVQYESSGMVHATGIVTRNPDERWCFLSMSEKSISLRHHI